MAAAVRRGCHSAGGSFRRRFTHLGDSLQRHVVDEVTSGYSVNVRKAECLVGSFPESQSSVALKPTEMFLSVRRSWTERTARSRRSGALTAPSRRNLRRWSSNWRRRVRDRGAVDFTWRMFTLLSLHTRPTSTTAWWKVIICSCAAQSRITKPDF